MPQPGRPQKEVHDKGEATTLTKIFREFKGVYTKADRTSIPPETFYDLLNLIPIGHANLHTIPDVSTKLFNFGNTDIMYWMQYACINSTDYLYFFATTGVIYQWNISTKTATFINPGKPMSGAGTRMDQWKNDAVLFVDTTGYYSWDGTTFTGPIAGGILPGGSLVSPDIAVYANRVWIYSNRVLYINDGSNGFDGTTWTLAAGALIQNLRDPQMRGQVVRMMSGNGYLYLLFKSSIFVISDVYVPTGASPPAPTFSIPNVQAVIGCTFPASVFFNDRDLCFANGYGLWALRGVTANRISEDIDGTLQYLDPSQVISGGFCKVQNIPQSCYLMKQVNDPVLGNRTFIAMFFDKKWWFVDYDPGGSLEKFICGAISNAQPSLFAITQDNSLFQLFFDNTSSPPSSWMTALWGMEDSLADKEVVRAGFEITSQQQSISFVITLDTQNIYNQIPISTAVGKVDWSNSSNQVVQWINNSSLAVVWTNGSYQLFYGDAQGGYAKYVGISGSAPQGSVYQMSSNVMDYYLRKRW